MSKIKAKISHNANVKINIVTLIDFSGVLLEGLASNRPNIVFVWSVVADTRCQATLKK